MRPSASECVCSQVSEPSYILVRFQDAPETARALRLLDSAWVDLPVGFLLVDRDPNPTVRCQLAITLKGSLGQSRTAAETAGVVPVGARRDGHTTRGGRGGGRGARNGARGGGRLGASAGAAPVLATE